MSSGLVFTVSDWCSPKLCLKSKISIRHLYKIFFEVDRNIRHQNENPLEIPTWYYKIWILVREEKLCWVEKYFTLYKHLVINLGPDHQKVSSNIITCQLHLLVGGLLTAVYWYPCRSACYLLHIYCALDLSERFPPNNITCTMTSNICPLLHKFLRPLNFLLPLIHFHIAVTVWHINVQMIDFHLLLYHVPLPQTVKPHTEL